MDQSPIQGEAVVDAIRRICGALLRKSDYLTALDQAIGDGDAGITVSKLATALLAYTDGTKADDIGVFLARAGMEVNRAAPSTLGTLTATALMRAGKVVKGKADLYPRDLVQMFTAADEGIRERGKAKLGDKTLIDALQPAREVFLSGVEKGADLRQAFAQAVKAAEAGRDRVTPERSKVGRASWVGERTEGQVDPGCEAVVIVLRAISE